MNPEAMSQALDAVYEVAQSMLKKGLPPEAREDVQLIMSIARYKTDVRGTDRSGAEPA
jgi:hypothetical protein